jgi:hypothetical protein
VQQLTEYDDLLRKAREEDKQSRFRAKELIPAMYNALCKENSNISAADAGDRIKRDCIQMWDKSIILDSLPDEAKDKEELKTFDITISDITEQFLKIITNQINNWNTRKDEVRAYVEFLNSISFFPMKFSRKEFQIDIGEIGTTKKIRLHSYMCFSVWNLHSNRVEHEGPVNVEQILDYLYEPEKIFENAIAVLTELAGAHKEKIAKLKFALRLVKASLFDDDEQEEGGVEYKD